MIVSDGMQVGGGAEGGGGDHNNRSNTMSPNDNNDGAEEEEAAVNIVKDKGEDFGTGSTSNDAATMMDVPTPLLGHCPLPLRGLPLQQDDRTAGAKNVAASATTVAKVGIVTPATSSSGAVMNTMDIVAW